MTSRHDIHVHISEVKIGREGDVLCALLGSCLGIALLWKRKKIYGLAHCLLPEASTTVFSLGARYVSQAVPSLIALMHIKKEEYKEIEAVIVGGGNMTNPTHSKNTELVGFANMQAAKKYLQERGIAISYENTGGVEGRKISVFCDTGLFEVEKIPRFIEN